MKIAIVSPDFTRLETMGRVLRAQAHSVTLAEGGKDQLRAAVGQGHTDLLVLEGMCEPAGLQQVEQLTMQFPRLAVILLCASHSPDFLIGAMRAGVREVLGSPVAAAALEAAVARVGSKLAGSRISAPGKVLAFFSCKGGSGATFLATNLAARLAPEKRVLLLDLNLQFGDALSFVHDARPASTLADVAHDILRLDASFLAASAVRVAPNFSLLAAPEDLAQALEIKPEHIDAILDLAQAQYDFIVLDIGRPLDALAIRALDHAWRIFPVLQAGLPYVRNAAKLLDVCKSLGYPADKIELMVNRFERHADIGIEDLRRSFGGVRLHTIPNAYQEVNAAINQGQPLASNGRPGQVARKLAELARAISPGQERPNSMLHRLFRRAAADVPAQA